MVQETLFLQRKLEQAFTELDETSYTEQLVVKVFNLGENLKLTLHQYYSSEATMKPKVSGFFKIRKDTKYSKSTTKSGNSNSTNDKRHILQYVKAKVADKHSIDHIEDLSKDTGIQSVSFYNNDCTDVNEGIATKSTSNTDETQSAPIEGLFSTQNHIILTPDSLTNPLSMLDATSLIVAKPNQQTPTDAVNNSEKNEINGQTATRRMRSLLSVKSGTSTELISQSAWKSIDLLDEAISNEVRRPSKSALRSVSGSGSDKTVTAHGASHSVASFKQSVASIMDLQMKEIDELIMKQGEHKLK